MDQEKRGLRIKAYDKLFSLKNTGLSRQETIESLHNETNIPIGTLYDWYAGRVKPYGRKGTIVYCSELYYVLGALLGDGCAYRWKVTNNYNILVGDKNFTQKYSKKLSSVTGKYTKPYIDRNKNIWFVRSNNYQLCNLFESLRKDLTIFFEDTSYFDALSFIEGFFDAEGCVKVIRGKERKTAKICLDFTNTERSYLYLIKKFLLDYLDINAQYSIQNPKRKNRKIVYHLRIYKKCFVKKFLETIHTTKLTNDKIAFVKKWIPEIKIKDK